jgi:hypothetical protein
MTDNEKAATYLDWKPETKCTAPCKPVDDHEFGDVWCPVCKEVFGCGNHDVKCPDMSKPENYMRALEVLLSVPHPMSWPTYVDFPCPARDNGKYIAPWGCTIRHRYHVRGFGTILGEAAINALAALYDAEHPQEKAA